MKRVLPLLLAACVVSSGLGVGCKIPKGRHRGHDSEYETGLSDAGGGPGPFTGSGGPDGSGYEGDSSGGSGSSSDGGDYADDFSDYTDSAF